MSRTKVYILHKASSKVSYSLIIIDHASLKMAALLLKRVRINKLLFYMTGRDLGKCSLILPTSTQ